MIKTGRRWVGWFSLSAALLFSGNLLANDLTVQATVDRNEMGVGDTFTLSVEVSSDKSLNVDDPRLPDLKAFELLNSWSGVESRSTFSNGTFEVVQSKNFNYMLATTKAGAFTIAPIQVVVDGKAYATKPIQIKVLEGAQVPQARRGGGGNTPPGSIDDMEDLFNQLLRRRMGPGGGEQAVNPNDSFFIKVETDKKKAYVGEQITASWWLYTRGQIHDIDTLKYPSLTGFWKEEIELATRLNFQQDVINGVVYQRALLASYALFPIKAGTATIDPYKAKCTVTVPSNFGFSRPYQFTKASPPIGVEVQEIPVNGRPADFTGAVGQFQASVTVDQTTVVANQPLTLKLKFEGRGNAKLIDLPPLNLPPTIEIYDTKFDAKFFREGTSYKEFSLTLIPRQPGPVTIPALAISAFDPQAEKFYSVAAQPLTINVLPGAAPQSLAGSGGGLLPTEKSKARTEPTLPLPRTEWQDGAGVSFVPTWLVWTVLYAFALAMLIGRWLKSSDFLVKGEDIRKEVKLRLNSMRGASGKNEWRRVGTEGTNLIYYVLGELSGIGGAGQELSKLMETVPPSVRRELAEPTSKILAQLELLSFAPEGLVGARREKTALNTLIKDVEQLVGRAIKLAKRELDQGEQTAVKDEAKT